MSDLGCGPLMGQRAGVQTPADEECQAPTPDQSRIMLRSIRHPIAGLGDLVAAVSTGQASHCGTDATAVPQWQAWFGQR